MSSENYLNHPTFGLLFRLCLLDDRREVFTTLYAQRLFFTVTGASQGLQFEAIGRNEARMLLETRMRSLRRLGGGAELDKLTHLHKQTFM
jgi:PII interaction protein X